MKKKLFYETPDVEVIELRLEQTIATSTNSADSDYDNDNDLGEI